MLWCSFKKEFPYNTCWGLSLDIINVLIELNPFPYNTCWGLSGLEYSAVYLVRRFPYNTCWGLSSYRRRNLSLPILFPYNTCWGLSELWLDWSPHHAWVSVQYLLRFIYGTKKMLLLRKFVFPYNTCWGLSVSIISVDDK